MSRPFDPKRPPSISEVTLYEDGNFSAPSLAVNSVGQGSVLYKYAEQRVEQVEEQQTVETSENNSGRQRSEKSSWLKRSRKASVKMMHNFSNALKNESDEIKSPEVPSTGSVELKPVHEPQLVTAPVEPLLIENGDVQKDEGEADLQVRLASDADPSSSPQMASSCTLSPLDMSPLVSNVDRTLITKASRLSLASKVTFAESQVNPHKLSSALQDMVSQWEQDMDICLLQISEYRKALHRKRERVQALENEIQQMSTSNARKEEAYQEILQLKANREEQFRELEDKLDSQLVEYKLLEQEKDALFSELMEQREAVERETANSARLSNVLQECQSALRLKDIDAKNALKSAKEWKLQLAEKDRQIAAIQKQNLALEKEISEHSQEKRSVMVKNAELTKSLEKLNREAEQFGSTRETLLSSFGFEKQALEKKQAEMTKLLVSQEREKRQLQSEISALREQLDTANQDLCSVGTMTEAPDAISLASQTDKVRQYNEATQTLNAGAPTAEQPVKPLEAGGSEDALDKEFERLDKALQASEARSIAARQTVNHLAREATDMHTNIDTIDGHLSSNTSSASSSSNNESQVVKETTKTIKTKRTIQNKHSSKDKTEKASPITENARQVLDHVCNRESVFDEQQCSRLESAVDDLVARNLLIDRLRQKVIKYKEANLRGNAQIERLKRKLLQLETNLERLHRTNDAHSETVERRVEQRETRVPAPVAPEENDSLSSVVIRRETSGGCCSSVTRVFKKRTTTSSNRPNPSDSAKHTSQGYSNVSAVGSSSSRSRQQALSLTEGSNEVVATAATAGEVNLNLASGHDTLRQLDVSPDVPPPQLIAEAVTTPSVQPIGSVANSETFFPKKVSFHTDYKTIAPPFQPTLTTFPLPHEPSSTSPPYRNGANVVPPVGDVHGLNPAVVYPSGALPPADKLTTDQYREAILKRQEQQRHRQMIA